MQLSAFLHQFMAQQEPVDVIKPIESDKRSRPCLNGEYQSLPRPLKTALRGYVIK
jgi:hypothetical protein